MTQQTEQVEVLWRLLRKRLGAGPPRWMDEESWRVEAREVLAALRPQEPQGDDGLATQQIFELAEFIIHNVDGEPSLSEGAVQCAIRIMREQAARITALSAEKAREVEERVEQGWKRLRSAIVGIGVGAPGTPFWHDEGGWKQALRQALTPESGA